MVPRSTTTAYANATSDRFAAEAKRYVALLLLMYGSLRRYTKYAVYRTKNVI